MKAWWRYIAPLAGLTLAVPALAADHRDAPKTKTDPAADINDVYTWVEGGKLLVAMTVFPIADATSQFSPEVQYVFHLGRGAAYGSDDTKTDIICTFAVDQTASCWVGTADYVTGDASIVEGLPAADGKFRVFAGLRADPFFFNLEGFNDAIATVQAAAGGLTFDGAGCPALDGATSALLVGMLQGTNSGADPAEDFFGALNTLSIVIELDPSLVAGTGDFVTVWASTHSAT